MRAWSVAEKNAVVLPLALLVGPARAYTSAGSTRASHASTDVRNLVTIVAIATINANEATTPAAPIAAKRGIAPRRCNASHIAALGRCRRLAQCASGTSSSG